VLPILHLNGSKIANPAVLARIPHAELEALFVGYGYRPHFVEGEEPADMHRQRAATLDTVLGEIREIQRAARAGGTADRPCWPMIVLRSPKGWTGPKEVDGKKTEGSWRSHQVPSANSPPRATCAARGLAAQLSTEELFNADGRPQPRIVAPRHGHAAARTPTPTAACC
jgi:xylulose-5-phosphate/fructose-6-phosphate phosphoketolase